MAILLREFAKTKKEEVRSVEKEILTLDKLYEKSKEIAFKSSFSDAEKVWFDKDLTFHYTANGEEKTADMSYWAYTQMCRKLGIPIAYVNKCVETDKEFAAKNLNYWIEHNPEMKVRVKEYTENLAAPPVISGIVSPQFSTTESMSVIKALKDTVGDNCDVVGSYCDYDRLHIRLVQKEETSQIRRKLKEYGEVGAGIFGGIVLNNSDVGQSSLRIGYLLYRLACTNGMIGHKDLSIYKRSHLGEIDRTALKIAFNNINSKIAENDEILSKQIVDAINMNPTDKDYERMLNFVKERAKINKSDMEKIKVTAITEYGGFGRAWALCNAITEVAHGYDIERRSELEGVANTLLMSLSKF